jgi:endoglucanase
MLKPVFIFPLLCLVLNTNCKSKTENDPQAVDSTAYQKSLAKGANLENWFNDYSDKSQFAMRFTAKEFQQIKNLGFTYVRLPMGSTVFYQENNPSQLNPQTVQYLDAAVKNATDAGLAIVIDAIHECCDEKVEKQLATNPAYVDKVAAYWKAIASRYKTYKPEQVFFEIFNEPHVATSGSVKNLDKNWWLPVQEKLIQAIRQETSTHYVIAGGEGWNGIEGLKAMIPYKIPRVIYNFHFYSPFTFTHQGATWVGDPFAKLRNVPYPSSPELLKPLVDAATDTQVKQYLDYYGKENFNAAKLESEIMAAVNWAKQNNVYITCNEFGAYKAFAPPASRANLIRDDRIILEKYNIGWAMWDYDQGFGIVGYPDNNRNNPVVDQDIAAALGLK